MKHLSKFIASLMIAVLIMQYYGFYQFAGWRGVICALVNMILYGLIAVMFSKSADYQYERAETYKAQLHNAMNDRNNFENELYNAKQQLWIHGLGSNPVK